MSQEVELDAHDKRILSILKTEGRLPVSEIAERVGLSKTPCTVRMKKLREKGVIKGFTVILDQSRIGRNHVAFVEVKLHDTSEAALTDFNKAVRQIPEIEQCHMIAGPFDYLLKVRTRDIMAYRRVLGDTISTLPHMANTSTFVVMESVLDTPV